MKRLFLLATLMIVTGCFTTHVQAQRKCGTMEYLAKQKLADPSLELRMQNYETALQKWIANNQGTLNGQKTTITIPVVVHVVYNLSAESITDARVLEQIDAMNKDFAGLNTHSMGVFDPTLKVNTGIQFCLAQRKPNGSATNGIERRQTTVTYFTDDDAVKYNALGGMDAWDPTKYINIWVCRLVDGLYGYSQFPTTGVNATFGTVICYKYFGITGATAPFNLGGTSTHEMGHCFNLYHTWGDDGGLCTGTDYCNDVPNQANYTIGAKSGLVTDYCSTTTPGIMYTNFMDYTDDISLANFTPDQNARMQALLVPGGLLYSLTTSDGCLASTSCGTPTGLSASNLTSTTATLNWLAVEGASSYNIQYRQVGTTNFTTTTSATTSKAITGLTPLTTYEFQVQAVCAVLGSFSGFGSFATGCTDIYESNNTLATAKTIAVNTAISALISTTADVDYFKFSNTSQKKNIKVTLTNLPADYDLRLYKPNGNLYATSQNSGLTNESITYNNASTGTYTLAVYSHSTGYSNFSCYTVTASISSSSFKGNMDDESDGQLTTSLLIYPNPARDNLNLTYTSETDAPVVIHLYDVTGRVVSTMNCEAVKGANQYSLSVKDLSKGFYMLSLESDGNRMVERLIIEK